MTTMVFVYLCVLGLCILAGIFSFKFIDKGLRIFFVLIVITFISELVSLKIKEKLGTKAPVYHFYNVIQLSFIGIYFLYTVCIKPKFIQMAGIILGSSIIGVVNLLFFQPLLTVNTNMLIVECILIIGMALFSLFTFLKAEDETNPVRKPHFQIWMALLILWSSSFFFWALLSYLKQMRSEYYTWISAVQTSINIIVYAWIGIVFFKQGKFLFGTKT